MAQPIPRTVRWGLERFMPRSVAQLTGMLVTAIVAFGTDMDLTWSVPLGVFAGALAMFFVSLSEARDSYRERWEKYKN